MIETASNIKWRYPGNQDLKCLYLGEILDVLSKGFRCHFSDLVCFGHWTENPRVGGSIPPLATMNTLVYSDEIGDGLYRRHG